MQELLVLEELFTNLEHQERYAHNDTCTYITCTHLPRHQSAHAICQSCRLFLLEDMQLPSTSCCSADQVIEHHAIMSQHKCLVNSEDYIGQHHSAMLRSMHSVGAVSITFRCCMESCFKLQDGGVVCAFRNCGHRMVQSPL